MIEREIAPRWAARKVASITAEDVEALHREITRRGAPIEANRCIACGGAIFPTSDPAQMDCGQSLPRDRAQSRDEARAVFDGRRAQPPAAILDDWPDQLAASAIRLMLLTGCRKSELLGARWVEFDLDAGPSRWRG